MDLQYKEIWSGYKHFISSEEELNKVELYKTTDPRLVSYGWDIAYQNRRVMSKVFNSNHRYGLLISLFANNKTTKALEYMYNQLEGDCVSKVFTSH